MNEERQKPVSKEETYGLIKAAQEGDKEAQETLILQNGGLVRKIAYKFKGFNSQGGDMEDLIQIGYIGLLKAIDKFNPSFNVMFSTYAVPMIMGEIRRFLRDDGQIKAGREIKREIFILHKAEEKLSGLTGEPPKISQLAEEMDMSTEHVLEILEADDNLNTLPSLDGMACGEDIQLPENSNMEAQIDFLDVKEAICNLPSKERTIMVMRYYCDMTQQEIAKRLGISQVQVSRTEKRCIAGLRGNLNK